MTLAPGTRLGVYEVVAPLGAGGMGEVYRAHDTALQRDVALKVLPAGLAGHPERMARFQREGKLLGSLNHPNIAVIHGIVAAGDHHALVMELVAGETLSARIQRGAIPLKEALRLARQIAGALEAAHEKGVVHRDLKPRNIMITPDGLVKVLDFGLAAIVHEGPLGEDAPTLSMSLTEAGTIMGTPAYMSPEQATGAAVDRRSDVWSYGVVLWEMLSGHRLFRAANSAETLAAVMRAPIDFENLKAPVEIQNLLRRCLDRDAKTRLRDIGEARIAIAAYSAGPREQRTPHSVKVPWGWIGWGVAVVSLALAAVSWTRVPSSVSGQELVLSIPAVPGQLFQDGELSSSPQISPDASAIMFQSVNGLELRRLNALGTQVLARGEFNPGFWSPDSKSYLYSPNDGTLNRLRVPEGAPEVVAKGIDGLLLGGSVSGAGNILFSAVRSAVRLYTIAAGSSEIKAVEFADHGEAYWPEFIPDSEDFIVLHVDASGEREVYLASLQDGKVANAAALMKSGTAAHYTPAGGGRLLFVKDDNLYSQRLNVASRKLEGDPVLVQRAVGSAPAFASAHFTVSRDGVIVWRPGTAGLSQVTALDRRGNEVGIAGAPAVVGTLRLAPDDQHLLAGAFGTALLLESGRPGSAKAPATKDSLWSVDGNYFLDVVSGPTGKRLVGVAVAGGAEKDYGVVPAQVVRLLDVSPDGMTLLYSRGVADTAVFSFRLGGSAADGKPLVQTGEQIAHAHFSPDGQWIVYAASPPDSSKGGIFTQPFPGPGLRTQVAPGGNYPVWRKDGREIVYLDEYQGKNYVWSITVTGPKSYSAPKPLFPVRMPASTFGDLNFLTVTKDGSRFYMPQAVKQIDPDVMHIRVGGIK